MPEDYVEACEEANAEAVGQAEKKDDRISICLVNGVEGGCIVINDYRVAGPKPWGGGRVVKEWKVERENLIHALIGTDHGRGHYGEVEDVVAALEDLETYWRMKIEGCKECGKKAKNRVDAEDFSICEGCGAVSCDRHGHLDSEGTDLCEKCWAGLVEEAKKEG